MKKILIASICVACLCSSNAMEMPLRHSSDWRQLQEIKQPILQLISKGKKEGEKFHKVIALMEKCEGELRDDIVAFGGSELLAQFPNDLIFGYKNASITDLFADIVPAETLATLEEQDKEKVREYISRFKGLFDDTPFAECLPEMLNFNIVVSSDDGRPATEPLDIISANLEAMNIFKVLKTESFEAAKLELKQLESTTELKKNKLWKLFKLYCLGEHIPVISGTRLPLGFIWPPEFLASPEVQKLFSQKQLKEKLNQYEKLYLQCKNRENIIHIYTHEIDRLNEQKRMQVEQAEYRLSVNEGEEIYRASRALSKSESRNMGPLMALARMHDIDEIRVFDAESLINSYYLSEEDRAHFLHLLKTESLEEVLQAIAGFVEESFFDEESLSSTIQEIQRRQRVFTHVPTSSLAFSPFEAIRFPQTLKETIHGLLREAAAISPVYRNAIIMLIALYRTEIAASCYYGRWTSPWTPIKRLRLTFRTSLNGSGVPEGEPNTVNLNLAEIVFTNSIQNFDSDEECSCYHSTLKTLLHEIGHIITIPLVSDISGDSVNPSKATDIAARSLRFKRNNALARELINFVCSLPDEKLLTVAVDYEHHMPFVSIPKEREKIIGFFRSLLTSDRFDFSVILINRPEELIQIFGLSSFRYNGRNILCVNLLSDHAAQMNAGWPIRIDHVGESYGEKSRDDYKYNPITVKINQEMLGSFTTHVNLNFYRIMLRAYGVNPDQWQARVHENTNMLMKLTRPLSNEARVQELD